MEPSTLIIFEEVPEDTKLFLVPNSQITAQQRAWLEQCQGRFINSDDTNDGMKFVNTAISDETAEEGFEDFQGIWKDKQTFTDGDGRPNALTAVHITAVYLTGFVM